MASPWWRGASVYQLYVRSFADANGDGIGDLLGIVERLPHIASLGVEAIWLNPCYPSPQMDHGYDVADYFDIEPDYGTLADFDALVASARAHGIRVLMDVVPNHCSSQHDWFKAAVASKPGSRERERFYFRPGRGAHGDEPPNNWGAIFGGSAWTRVIDPDGMPGEWYLGVFASAQPDWNFENPDVIEHFDRMLRFWFDRGVEGFRADAVTMIGKAPGLPDWAEAGEQAGGQAYEPNPHFTWQPHGHAAWRHWRDVVGEYEREHPGRELLLVAEAYRADDPDFLTEYANDREFHQTFAFDLMLAPWRAEVFHRVIDGTIRAHARIGQLPTWTLNNHDTQRSVTRYGRADIADRTDLFPGAIVNTTVPVDVSLGLCRARAAALLLLSLPGSAYLYAGEELGLPEVLDVPPAARQDPVYRNTNGATIGRDGCRIPLPWTMVAAGAHGFSPVGSSAPWLPQPHDWGVRAMDRQGADPTSTLSMYRLAGAIRRDDVELREGPFAWAPAADDVVAFSRGAWLVVLNMSASPAVLDGALVGARTVRLSSLHGHDDPLVVPANTTVWLR